MNLILLYSFFITFLHPHAVYESTERWLVEMKSADSRCLDQWWEENGLNRTHFVKKILPVDDWYAVEVPKSYSASLAGLPCVSRVMVDQRIEWRNTEPNDPSYINQSNLNMISMSKAWDFSTGGLTSRGDTIVVAVVDDGFDVQHQDLIPNIWLNRGEIPGDGIDNDANGYIDDYKGLNIISGNDQHDKHQHGTQVSGVIGAKGNNNLGISGINWNVKLMLISGASVESEVIEGYQYAIDMRKKYNMTNGHEGAFVVVTNLSAGIDNALASDHPLWCQMYDKLGEAGILSVASGPNHATNVDVDGDMPTTCTSSYLIAVTSIDQTGVLVENAGYGSTSIDIGAPGESILTLDLNNKYNGFSGTSAAAPHVAGLVALMYSSPCVSLLNNIDVDPSGVALKIKDLLLKSGKSVNSLQSVTVTGKRIQADAAMKATNADCGTEVEPEVKIISIVPNPARLEMARIYLIVKGDTTDTFMDLFTSNGDWLNTFPVSHAEIVQGYYDLNVSPLPAGVYLLTLRNREKKNTFKLVVL